MVLRRLRFDVNTPSFKSFLELPIYVQHFWEAYPAVDEALVDLEQGRFQTAAYLADAVYTDDRVTGVISTRINALFGLPMEFKYQGQDEHEGDEESVQDEVTKLKLHIRKKAERQWERMFPAAALKELVRWGLLLNAGIGQLEWQWDEDDNFLPVLKVWNPQFLYWRWDTRSFWLIHMAGQVQINPGAGTWVLFSPSGHNHGWLYGLIRALGKLWLDRVFTFRDWSRFEEKLGLGILKGKMPSDALDKDKKDFEAALKNPAGESTFLLPQTKDGGFDVEMMATADASNATSADAFDKRVKQLDTSIAVCVLGQNLSTEISGSSGSRAAAQVHENIREDYLKADVEILSSMLKAQVLSPWVRHNWADEAKRLGVRWQDLVPSVTWKVSPPNDKKAESEAIKNIAQAIPGLKGTQADIRALLEKYEIPTLEAGDEELEAEPPPADTNERPRGKDGDDSDVDYNDAGGIRLSRLDGGVTSRGAAQGRIFVDDLTENASRDAARTLDPLREKLRAICLSGVPYEEMRSRIVELYRNSGKSPAALRELVANAVIVANLVGQKSVHIDTNGK